MKNRSRLLVSMIAATASTLALLPPLSAQEITFTFHPPDSITFLQIQTIVKNTDMGQMDTIDEVVELVTRMTITRTMDGYSVTATPLSITATRNGQPVDDPILALAQNIVVDYHLDKSGKLVKIGGYERLKDIMREIIPAEICEALSAVLNEEALKQRDAAEWNRRIGNFVGMRAIPGDSWAAIDSIPIPTGEHVTFYSLTRHGGQAECDNHQCVKLVFDYNSDASALTALANDSLGGLLGRAADSFSSGTSEARIVGSGQRLIDPSTMLIYYEVVERTLTGKMTRSDQVDADVVETERREYKYDYSY